MVDNLKMCSGCGSCSAICPKSCIELKRNENGCYHPITERDKCIDCGLCEQVCPQMNLSAVSLDESKLYAAYAKNDNMRKQSSSGAVAWILAEDAIREGYSVCGAAYNQAASEVQHKIYHTKEHLDELKGSKYLQSNTAEAFQKIVDFLKEDNDNKMVIFGTPCQIAGMNQVLIRKKLRDRAVLIDIFCHGVSSYLLWDKYWEWLEKKHRVRKDEMSSLTFRDKEYSWHKYYMHIRTRVRGGGGILAMLIKTPS